MNNNERISHAKVANGVASMTVSTKGITTYEARAIARREGRRLLGTVDVQVMNKGHVDGFGFYEVRAY
ncbi:hypothetical protein QDW42_gp15 [Microbacterium phage Swervy]|uniref:hypothetical protein n=1 Tax=Microbacterium phage Swervy TaxID=2867473 RepID=UPI001E7653DB|nr:hypothetical protein QDW42_gp15 [Microbacterium phage Swervy]UAW08602.1 hypothetical protein Swervy_15 [Microbacterium phage Swervy]